MLRAPTFILTMALALPCLAGRPLPPENALDAAKRLVIDAFRKELSAPDKAPVVQAMIETAGKTEVNADKAALYLSAADVAARAGETKLAFVALEQLAGVFDVDLLALKLAAIESGAQAARTTEARVAVANRSLELAEDAAKGGRFEVAESALKAAAAATSRVRDAELRRTISVKRREMERAKRQHEQELATLEAARKTLQADPNDAEANETFGKHLAFDLNDWGAGLKHLAKAADSDLQKVALADQSGATEQNQATTLADWWWSLRERADNTRDKSGYQSRAVYWYTRAVSSLTGLQKTRVEKRLKEAGDAALAAAASQAGNDDGKFIDVTLAPGVVIRMVKIPASADGKVKDFYLGQTEVTQKQWTTIMGDNPTRYKGDNFPVANIAFEAAAAFCDRVQAAAPRLVVRVPTIDEQIHAQLVAFVNIPPSRLEEFAWVNEKIKDPTHPTATKMADALGLFDLVGNVNEWCRGGEEVSGGSRNDMPAGLDPSKVRYRCAVGPGFRANNTGLRIAADLR